jgi:hypothetical protein
MKAIHIVLDLVMRIGTRDDEVLAREALAEVEAIEKAAADLERLGIGDFIYDIRDSSPVLEETSDGSSTWEHPNVKAWSDASSLIAAIARQSGEKKA